MDPNYSPMPQPGQTVDPNATSDTWAIGGVFSGGASALIFGGTAAILQLVNTKTAFSWPYVFFGAGISLGSKAGATLSNPAWTVFTTPVMGPSDFDSFGSIKGGEMVPLIGGSLTYVNLYSVDHSPNPLDVGGVTVGLPLGANWTPGRFVLIESLGHAGPQTSSPDDVAKVPTQMVKNGWI